MVPPLQRCPRKPFHPNMPAAPAALETPPPKRPPPFLSLPGPLLRLRGDSPPPRKLVIKPRQLFPREAPIPPAPPFCPPPFPAPAASFASHRPSIRFSC